MGSQQHFHVMQLLQLLMGDGLESSTSETVHLGSVVHDIAQAVKMLGFVEFLLCFPDGCRHSEAKARTVIYLNNGHYSRKSLLADANY